MKILEKIIKSNIIKILQIYNSSIEEAKKFSLYKQTIYWQVNDLIKLIKRSEKYE